MGRMIMELIKRWKCSKCGYITFKKHRECPMCSYGVDMMERINGYEKEESSDNS